MADPNELLNSKHGRSATGAERPNVIPSTSLLYLFIHGPQYVVPFLLNVFPILPLLIHGAEHGVVLALLFLESRVPHRKRYSSYWGKYRAIG